MTIGSVLHDSLAELRSAVIGPVLIAGDPEYDEVRLAFNGMYDWRRPAVIVRPLGVADVQAAIAFARAHELVIAVRGGGHSVSGASGIDGGLLIDMGLMRGVRVDPERRTALAAAGTLFAEFDRETQVHGLATTGGMVSNTGIAGLTLGGGVGRFMRKVGLTCDNVLSFDVVTADGEWRHVDAHHHPDLFWALRGGGGDFGVVTHFEYQLHPLGPTVYGGWLTWPLHQAPELFSRVRDEIENAPEELQLEFLMTTAPDLDFMAQLRGQPVLVLATTWMGDDLEEGQRQISPFREKVPPTLDLMRPTSYAKLQALADGMSIRGRRFYTKTGYFRDLTDEVVELATAYMSDPPSPIALIEIYQMGGAVARVPPDATAASAFRQAGWYYIVSGAHVAEEDDALCADWARRLDDAFDAFRLPGRYINFVADDDEAGQRDAIGDRAFARLAEIKAKYDPDAVFARNPNKPGAAVRTQGATAFPPAALSRARAAH
jgi:FAD/FMN-containing dehydrogenase